MELVNKKILSRYIYTYKMKQIVLKMTDGVWEQDAKETVGISKEERNKKLKIVNPHFFLIYTLSRTLSQKSNQRESDDGQRSTDV
jgi:hypothetical protein